MFSVSGIALACSLHGGEIMHESNLKFIELTGGASMKMLGPNEVKPEALRAAGLTDKCFVRVNQQGDIEVRRHDRWDVIGGLLGDFDHRLKKASGLEWA